MDDEVQDVLIEVKDGEHQSSSMRIAPSVSSIDITPLSAPFVFDRFKLCKPSPKASVAVLFLFGGETSTTSDLVPLVPLFLVAPF